MSDRGLFISFEGYRRVGQVHAGPPTGRSFARRGPSRRAHARAGRQRRCRGYPRPRSGRRHRPLVARDRASAVHRRAARPSGACDRPRARRRRGGDLRPVRRQHAYLSGAWARRSAHACRPVARDDDRLRAGPHGADRHRAGCGAGPGAVARRRRGAVRGVRRGSSDPDARRVSALAEQYSHRFVVIDGGREVDAVAADIARAVEARLP